MRKYIFTSILLLVSSILSGQGIMFRGQNNAIDQRSSLEIVNRFQGEYKGSMEVSFGFRCYPEFRNGYVMSMKTNGKDKGAPSINLFYDGAGSRHTFMAIWEGHRYITALTLPRTEGQSPWIDVTLAIDSRTDSLTIAIGGPFNISSSGWIDLPERIRPEITFGKSGHIIDIPAFGMKDLRLSFNDRDYRMGFSENSGNRAGSNSIGVYGKASNIVWLSNDSCHWKKVASFSSRSMICAGFDKSRHSVYAFDRDSIRTYSIDRNSVSRRSFKERCPVEISLGTSLAIPSMGKILAYEFYYDRGRHSGKPCTLALLDTDEGSWEELTNEQGGLQLHHHCEYIDTANRRILLFGGFGNRRFNGRFYEITADELKWNMLPELDGDKIEPRYFAAMGHNDEDGLLYIFGGLGNEIGDQIVGRQYMYNLYSADLENGTSKLLWNAKWQDENIIVARNMVIPGDGYFYVLSYPESLTRSEIQLIRFRLSDGSYERLGDRIPIYSDKITTNANLFYDKEKELLLALIEESPDDIKSTVNVYALDFPPSLPGTATTVIRARRTILWILTVSFILVSLITATAIKIRRTIRSKRAAGRKKGLGDFDRPNSIRVFGGFRALDRNGEDISPLFTGKVLQLFCLLLRGERSGGTTSKRITSKLWPDRDPERAKNIRGVTISKLRKILENIDGISLEYSEGKFNLSFTDSCHCDYKEFFDIARSRKPDVDRLIQLIHHGRVLSGETSEEFDRFKSEVEELISKSMTSEMVKRYESRQYMYAIECADILFAQDSLDEAALIYEIKSLHALRREDDARVRYMEYVTRYRKDYNEPYPKSFEQILRMDNMEIQ